MSMFSIISWKSGTMTVTGLREKRGNRRGRGRDRERSGTMVRGMIRERQQEREPREEGCGASAKLSTGRAP
jgi:hypothetical protein